MARQKKSIADMASAAAGDIIGAKDVQDVQDTHNVHDTQDTYVRLNLRIPQHVKDYLYEASWRESTATRRVSVTAYLVELVEKDMREHESK